MFIPFEVEIENEIRPPVRQVPVAVYALILVCLLIHFKLYFGLDESARVNIFYRFGAARFGFTWWQALTCTLLHGSWGHIIGNLYFLWIYGKDLEKFFGSLRFMLLYIGGAFVSMGIHLATTPAYLIDEPAIGASGAISALLGAFFVVWPSARLRCLFFSFISFRPIVFKTYASVILALWFLGQLVYSLKLIGAPDDIAFWAHAGGFMGGALIGASFRFLERRKIHEYDSEARRPLVEAWQAYFRHDRDAVRRHCAQIDESAVMDGCGSAQLIKGLGESKNDSLRGRTARFVKAFCQARDYRRNAMAVTVYLHILQVISPEDVPPFMHRDAGQAAFTLGHRDLALQAFRQALLTGCDEGLDLMLRAVKGTAKKSRQHENPRHQTAQD